MVVRASHISKSHQRNDVLEFGKLNSTLSKSSEGFRSNTALQHALLFARSSGFCSWHCYPLAVVVSVTFAAQAGANHRLPCGASQIRAGPDTKESTVASFPSALILPDDHMKLYLYTVNSSRLYDAGYIVRLYSADHLRLLYELQQTSVHRA